MRDLSDEDYQRAYRYAVTLAADPQSGFDLLHATLAHLLGRMLPEDAGLAYLLRAIRNRFIDGGRRDALLQWSSLDDGTATDRGQVIATDFSPLEDLAVNQDLLAQCWQRLSAVEREVLFLWAVEGFSVDDIAVQTSTPRGTLLARLHRLRKRLQAMDAADWQRAGERA